MGVNQFQYPPCTSLHFWKPVFDMPARPEKRCFLERRASPMSKKHHFGPPPDLYIGSFLFFTKNVFWEQFPYTNHRPQSQNLYRKNRQNTSQKHVLLVKTKMTLWNYGGGPKWCFLDIGDARRSKKHLFSG